jgi:hypothetical protein
MADRWEYRTAEAGTFKLDRLLAQGWEAYTTTEQPARTTRRVASRRRALP